MDAVYLDDAVYMVPSILRGHFRQDGQHLIGGGLEADAITDRHMFSHLLVENVTRPEEDNLQGQVT